MENKKINKILIVVAHPDDEVLGCGGTIAKYSKTNEIYCLFLGKGKASRFDEKQNETIKEEQLIIEKEAHRVAEILGVSQIIFENFPDQRYDTNPFLEIVKSIERVAINVKPDIVFTHHLNDLNLDHRIVAKAVLTALRPFKNKTVKKIYSFEIPYSSFGQKSDFGFSPNFFVDIQETFNKKIEALKTYQSEIQEYPHPRSLRAIEVNARHWGICMGRELIEVFELIREID